MKFILSFIFAFTFFLVNAQTKLDGIAINIDLPNGWNINTQEYGSILLGHHSIPGFILIVEHGNKTQSDLMNSIAEGVNEGGMQLQTTAIHTLPQNLITAAISGMAEYQRVKGVVVGSKSDLWQIGGVFVLALVKEDLYSTAHKEAAIAIAQSIEYRTLMDTQAQQWAQLVKGRRLVKYDNYYSGSTYTGTDGGYSGDASVGFNNKETIHLCSDGNYAFQSQSSSTMSNSADPWNDRTNNSNSNEIGMWSLLNIGNTPVFRLIGNDGSVAYYPVTDYQESGAIFINGEKWVIGASSLCH